MIRKPADAVIIISPDSVRREVTIAPGVINTEVKDPVSFISQLGKVAPYDTGLMPPGVINLRQTGDHLQATIVCPPGLYPIFWVDYEGQKSNIWYLLAQPWRVIVADFVNNTLLGARMFYSPTLISNLDQPMYCPNVPNINLRGYGQPPGNGICWQCLYLREDMSTWPLGQKLYRVIERSSGFEAYNDQNMSETDGPRFYHRAKKPEYLWNPKLWEAKSKAEGWEWTLQPDVWIPILVGGVDDQTKYKPDGVPLTLRMAMEGHTAAYYGDTYPKPVNEIARGAFDPPKAWEKIWQPAFNTSVTAGAALPAFTPKPTDALSQASPPSDNYEEDEEGDEDYEEDQSYYLCHLCQLDFEEDQGEYAGGNWICWSCAGVKFCPGCEHKYSAEEAPSAFVIDSNTCTNCTDTYVCNVCQLHIAMPAWVNVGKPALPAPLCMNCFEALMLCSACNQLRNKADLEATNEGAMLCDFCVEHCQICKRATWVGVCTANGNCPQCEDFLGRLAEESGGDEGEIGEEEKELVSINEKASST